MRHSLSLAILLLLFACQPKPQFDLVITNAMKIDLNTGQIDMVSVFIKDGKIGRITDIDENISADSRIDASGKYLLPGFWDNHVHFRGGDSLIADNKDFLKLYLANGITTVRDAGGDMTPAVMEWKKNIEKGTLDGPTIFTSGPKIDGPGATWAGSLEVVSEVDINNALDSLEKIPVDFVKLYDSKISREAYLGTIREADKRGLITSGHMPFTTTLQETIDAGIDGIEHLYYVMKGCSNIEIDVTKSLTSGEIGFWQAMPLLQHSYDSVTAAATFESLKKNKVFVVPTLHIGKTLSYLDENDHSDDSYLKYISPSLQKTYQGRIDRVKHSNAETIQNRKDLDAFFGRLTKQLDEAEVSLLAGSDCGAFNSFTYPGISLHKEMEAMVFNGISPLNALRNSAYNGAKFLNKDTLYGNVEAGKIADLVLLEANPLEDITNSQKITYVIKQGKVYDALALEQLLESAEKR